MFIDMAARPYTLRKRALSQEETRARIVDATVAVHEELGPRNATITAIAERAGVQRLTVYRHFPDEDALFAACTGKWLGDHPPPQPETWEAGETPLLRCRSALVAFYRYYAGTRRMWQVSFRDEPEIPALKAPMNMFRSYLASVSARLALDFGGNDRVKATVTHLLAFPTWESLADQGLDPEAAADLAMLWVAAAADAPRK